jgi:hypothetical protein
VLDGSFEGIDLDRGVPGRWRIVSRAQGTQNLPGRHRRGRLDADQVRVLAAAGELARDRGPP